MNNTIKNILNCEEVLENNLPLLEKMYIEDYGKKYKYLIHKRLQDTIYIINSLPDVEYAFIKKYAQNSEILNNEYFIKYCEDYIKLKDEMIDKCNNAIFELICNYLNINKKDYYKYLKDIITLPFSSYSSFSKMQGIDNINITVSNDIKKIQNDYLTKCSNIGIPSLTNPKKIDDLLKKIDIIKNRYNNKLLLKSNFMDNMQYSIYSMINTTVRKEELYQFLTYPAACASFLNGDTPIRIVRIPLIEIQNKNLNIDSLLLHEVRHAVEADLLNIGLDSKAKNNCYAYTMLNELRTEKHAKEDLKRIDTIFGRTNKFSYYYGYTFIIDEFIDKYRHFIDDCSINNNINILETFFKKEQLQELEYLLQTTYYKDLNIHKFGYQNFTTIDPTIIFDKISNLYKTANNNGLKRYQKNLKKINKY